MAQMRRLAPLVIALVAVATTIGWTLTRPPGDLLDGQTPQVTVDCEAASSGPVRQPVNAWTALAYTVVGTVVVSRRDRHSLLGGAALIATGLASFVLHARLDSWSARLDGLAVAALAGTLALWAWKHRVRFRTGTAAAAAALAAAGWSTAATAGLSAVFGAAVAARLFGPQQRSRLPLALGATALLAPGAILWKLGGSNGAWCRPQSPFQAHAAWHLLSAAALGMLVAWMRAAEHTTPAERL